MLEPIKHAFEQDRLAFPPDLRHNDDEAGVRFGLLGEFDEIFRWTENAIAFWDNRCTQHRAMWDYWPHTRAGTRVTVKGERPV